MENEKATRKTHRKSRRPCLDPPYPNSTRQPVRGRVINLESFQGAPRFCGFAVPFSHDAGVGGRGGGGREDRGEGTFVRDGAEEGGDACVCVCARGQRQPCLRN